MNRLPTLFISHGAPTFALEPGIAGPALTALGTELPRPKAVLVVSPHWMTTGPVVSASPAPETIHDFGGFDPALYRLRYPAAGAPALAERTAALLEAAGWPARVHPGRGLDHGAWVPMLHLYTQADVPVFQVSLPVRLTGESAYALGQALAPLADEGVLIVGSGSLTHNLYEVAWHETTTAAYAREFSDWIRDAVLHGRHAALRNAIDEAPSGHRAHPTPEHYWPLVVAAGAAGADVPTRVIEGGIEHGVLAMDGYVFGAVAAATASADAEAATV
ncbi:dioxygenase family protein [Hydrogenophaga electricum]|uniref:Dioxygenase n=1 Tax=Hydrogenophaga electricum TaxID=1230953 RepID=A0ABQ6C5A8_9BURK|nr:class III extradiol ring-cleavage dioxygenase [Hydrogenophaga electricum]GLS15105.1 dioxygenase [Hydrogenophaga electricum]